MQGGELISDEYEGNAKGDEVKEKERKVEERKHFDHKESIIRLTVWNWRCTLFEDIVILTSLILS